MSVTPQVISDALELGTIHVNRTLRTPETGVLVHFRHRCPRSIMVLDAQILQRPRSHRFRGAEFAAAGLLAGPRARVAGARRLRAGRDRLASPSAERLTRPSAADTSIAKAASGGPSGPPVSSRHGAGSFEAEEFASRTYSADVAVPNPVEPGATRRTPIPSSCAVGFSAMAGSTVCDMFPVGCFDEAAMCETKKRQAATCFKTDVNSKSISRMRQYSSASSSCIINHHEADSTT